MGCSGISSFRVIPICPVSQCASGHFLSQNTLPRYLLLHLVVGIVIGSDLLSLPGHIDNGLILSDLVSRAGKCVANDFSVAVIVCCWWKCRLVSVPEIRNNTFHRILKILPSLYDTCLIKCSQ